MKTGAAIIVAFVTGMLVVPVTVVVGAFVTIAIVDDGTQASRSAPELVAGPRARLRDPVAPPPQATTLERSKARPVDVDADALLNIPRLRLKAAIGTKLNEGPAWWPITGRPGARDTIAIAGHRTTYTRPFYWLERLRPGDRIYVSWQGRVHRYRVSGRRVLSAKNMHIADARGYEVLLLSACTPRGSAKQRLVVYAWPDWQRASGGGA